MLRKIVTLCSASLLIVSAGIEASDTQGILYVPCVDGSDRFQMRAMRTACDDYALGIEGSVYHFVVL